LIGYSLGYDISVNG
jgi:hypothetical protein